MSRVILHSDMNNCYASIELLHRPELRGKPLAVGGDPEARHGIVLAKDQLAKKAGDELKKNLPKIKELSSDIINGMVTVLSQLLSSAAELLKK